MDNTPRGRVRQTLDLLKPYLVAHVTSRLAPSAAAVPAADAPDAANSPALVADVAPAAADTATGPTADGAPPPATVPRRTIVGPVHEILAHWRPLFAAGLPAQVPLYLRDLVDVHRRWRGGEPFTDREARRAADTAWLVAAAVGAPPLVLDTFDRLAAGTAGGAPAHPSLGGVGAGDGDEPEIRRDAAGVIVNAAELTFDDVARQRVRCPACEAMDFATWPSGWDAHAAHRCMGIAASGASARKAEFRARFPQLFRAPAAGGGESR